MLWLVGTATALAVVFGMPWFRTRTKLTGRHVIITGGSDGLGYCMAKQLVGKGCRVSIIARTQSKLDRAVSGLQSLPSSAGVEVQAFSADVTNCEQVQSAVQQAESNFGPCDVLVSNAGITQPGRFQELPLSAFQDIMAVNYMGAVHATKAVLPSMIQQGSGHLVYISSSMGLLGFAGYTAYAPSKYALRGFADCLRNELQGTGVKLSIGFPADMDTECYKQEELIKPKECKEISSTFGSLYQPEQVAKKFVDSLQRGQYHLSTPDLGQDLFMMDATASWSPRNLPVLVSCLLAPIVPVVMFVCTKWSDYIVRKQRKSERHM